MFTKEEKENIEKEFTYSKRINRNQNTLEAMTSTIESDWFTEQNIDCSQSELTKNITSKSVILAPFNSTLTDHSEQPSISKELIAERRVIKLCAKIREIDRQYEKNNNCEVDNGVYNKIAYETKDQKDCGDLNPLASNEGSIEGEEAAPERSVHGCVPSRADVRKSDLPTEAVQTYLLNSLAPRPLVIGTCFCINVNR